MLKLIGTVLIPALFMFLPTLASAACRQALALGLDISGSVDEDEYRLQLDGLAGALLNKDVQAAFTAMPDAHVTLMIYEWAGLNTQRIIVNWTPIETIPTLQAIALKLRQTPRRPHAIETALGRAMQFGDQALASQPHCWRHTLDLSGDGQSNVGPRPRDARKAINLKTTINAIVVGEGSSEYVPDKDSEIGRLKSYFTAEVIHGPNAFVEAANGFKDFEAAMARKLLKELQTLAMGSLSPEHQ